jgi:putative peptidoglycan lipid II flippase
LIQFPLGVFSTALSQAILPTFSTQALEDNRDRLKQTLSWGLRAVFFVMLPASFGFMVLARPIVSTLFEGGRFNVYATDATANALLFYSIGLFAYGATKIAQSCFFSLKDTVTPTKIAGLTLVMNIILNAILMFPLKIAGLALATSISGIITFVILVSLLKMKLGDFKVKEIIISFIRISAACVCMGIVCYLVSKNLFLGPSKLDKVINLTLSLISGIISYIGFCFMFRVNEMQELWKWLVSRRVAS